MQDFFSKLDAKISTEQPADKPKVQHPTLRELRQVMATPVHFVDEEEIRVVDGLFPLWTRQYEDWYRAQQDTLGNGQAGYAPPTGFAELLKKSLMDNEQSLSELDKESTHYSHYKDFGRLTEAIADAKKQLGEVMEAEKRFTPETATAMKNAAKQAVALTDSRTRFEKELVDWKAWKEKYNSFYKESGMAKPLPVASMEKTVKRILQIHAVDPHVNPFAVKWIDSGYSNFGADRDTWRQYWRTVLKGKYPACANFAYGVFCEGDGTWSVKYHDLFTQKSLDPLFKDSAFKGWYGGQMKAKKAKEAAPTPAKKTTPQKKKQGASKVDPRSEEKKKEKKRAPRKRSQKKKKTPEKSVEKAGT